MNRSILEVGRLVEYVTTPQKVIESLNYERGGGLGASFARLLSGHTLIEADRVGLASQGLIDKDFKGDALAFKAFMGRMTKGYFHGGAAALEFGEFVLSGAASKLIELERRNPNAFDAVLSGTFSDKGTHPEFTGHKSYKDIS